MGIEFETLLEYIIYRIDRIALNDWTIYRIIIDGPIEKTGGLFTGDPPKQFASDPDMQFTTQRWYQHPMKGWGTKPDNRMHMIGEDIEVWRLHKNEPILTFEQWINSTS